MDEKDSQDIAWLILGAVLLFGVWRVWTLHVRPWVTEQWTALRGAAAAGDLDGLVVDVVGVTAIAVPVLVLLLLVRSGVRRRRRAEVQEDGLGEPGQPTKKTMGRKIR